MIWLKKLTMDYVNNLEGTTHMPQLGWVIESDKRDVRQEAYRLQIAEEDQFRNCLYDSGTVYSSESQHHVPELALESLKKYYVRVRVRTEHGEISTWSEPASFLTGLVENEWEAKFISADSEEDARNSKGTYVRKEFTIQGKIRQAYLCSTALGLYEVYLNGRRVGKDQLAPGFTSYRKHLVYQTYDVSGMLEEGENAIGAMLGAGWYKGKMGFIERYNIYGSRSAFLGQLMIQYEDGTVQMVVTDDSWKGKDSPVIFAEIYDGEIYDASKEVEGWNKPGLKVNGWKRTEEIPFDMEVLTAQPSARTAEIEALPATRVFRTPQGDMVVDFGQNLTGWICVTAAGKKGDMIELNCFEVLDKDGNVYTDNLDGAKQQIRYIFAEDKTVAYHPRFTFQGFQYAKITSYPGNPETENFTAYAVHSDMEMTGKFTCSNQDINQLQHNILWGMKGNFIDIPTDCPQRDERLGWTGDAQIFCRTASYLMNTYHFYKKWLRDVEADQTAEGGIPHVIPDIISGYEESNWLLSQGTHSAAAWADVAVIMPWVLYQTFGDTEILKIQYDSMKKWIGFMRAHAVDYIWNYKLQFGDWVALDAEEGSYFGATPNDLTCTAYFAYTTGLFVKICGVLGKTKEKEEYQKLYNKIVRKYQKTFFLPDGTMTVQTQTAHIVSLYFGLVPEEYKQAVAAGLIKLLEKENGHLVTGFVGTPYFCHALSENGYIKEAYDLLLKDDFPSWLYQVRMGATTIWEHWDGIKPDGSMWSPNMNSFNHYAYGAVGEWLYRVCTGIEIDESNPGYRHTIFQPHPGGGFTYAEGVYESIYGTVRSKWSVDGDSVTLEVEIPVNTTGTIMIEAARKIQEADGLDFQEINGRMQAQAGSGEYRIVYRI